MRRERYIYLALILATAALFWPVREFRFVNLDDWGYLIGERRVELGLTTSNIAWAFQSMVNGNWHPLTWLSWMLDSQLFGMNAGAFHLVNLLFHILNSLLVFHVLRQLTREIWPSAIVAALFALHPLHVESVAWVTERKDTLSTFFGLLTLIWYVHYARLEIENRKSRIKNYLLTLLLFALGLLSKPMLVTWPFVLLLLDFWPLQRISLSTAAVASGPGTRPSLRLVLLEKLPFLALSIGSCAMTLASQSGMASSTTHLSLLQRSATALTSYARYLSKTFWPVNLSAYYPFPFHLPAWQVFVSAVVLVSITVVAVYMARSRPYFVFGWFWFLGTLVPVIGIVAPNDFPIADRYMYIPSIGLFVMIVWGARDLVSHLPTLRPLKVPAAIVALAGCMVVTGIQLQYWRDTETLFRHSVAVTPPNAMARHILGKALFDKREYDESLTQLNEALRIDPKLAAAHAVIAQIMQERGDFREAVHHYRESIRSRPDTTVLLNNLAWLLATCSDPTIRDGAEAVRLAESACSQMHDPEPLFIGTLGAAYAEAGRFDDAIRTGERARDIAAASGKKMLAQRNQELLDIYRQGKAYHEPPGKN